MKHLIFIAFMALALAPSCKKDNINPIKTLTSLEYQYTNDTTAVYYTYDAQGRLLTANDGEDIVTYMYNGNEVTIKEWRNSENREVFYFKGTLNANGDLSGGTATSKYSPNNTYEQTHEYEYDANGYLVKASITRNNNQTYSNRYFYTNGNLTKQESYTNNTLDYSFLYEYATGYPTNTAIVGLYSFVPENTLTGKNSAEKPIKFTRVRPGSPDESHTFAYVVDADGYVIQQTSVQSNGSSYTVLYHYE